MKKHKTLLISCFIEDSPQAMPLASALLKSYVSDIDSLDVELNSFTINSDPAEAAKEILAANPQSVGCSVYIWNSSFFSELIPILKQQSENLIVYAGGAEVTASADKLMESPLYDYLIPGEGEISFRKLLLHLTENANAFPERLFEREHETDINRIPSPYLEGNINPENYDGLLWELSRGCPFNCAFCCESRGVGGVRYFSNDRITEELKLFEERGVEQVWVLDPTFNINKERTLTILALIEEIAPHIHYTFEIRAELLDEETAEAFSRLHCSLQIGLQSCHQSVLKHLNRNIDRKLFSEKIDLLNRYGVVFGIDLIYGLPGDNRKGFLESLDYAINLIPNHLDLFRLSVFPGTELYDKAELLKLEYENQPPYSVISNETFSAEELEAATEIADAADLFYNKGKAAPWLLPVLNYINSTASQFFTRFASFISTQNASSDDILKLQTDFLIQVLASGNSDDGLAVIMDLVHFHHLYSRSLFSDPVSPPEYETLDYSCSIYKRSSTLQTGIFSFDVTLYWELGMFDIEPFINQYGRDISYGLLFSLDGEISVMALEKTLYQFLQNLDGEKTIGEILNLINAEAEELDEFIGFLIETGLIISAAQ